MDPYGEQAGEFFSRCCSAAAAAEAAAASAAAAPVREEAAAVAAKKAEWELHPRDIELVTHDHGSPCVLGLGGSSVVYRGEFPPPPSLPTEEERRAASGLAWATAANSAGLQVRSGVLTMWR